MVDDDFSSLFGEKVDKLNTDPKTPLEKREKDSQESLERRRHFAVEYEQKPEDPLAGEPVTMLGALDLLAYKKPGVQHGVYKNVRLGKYSIDARLDLHRLNVEQARQAVYRFVKDCFEHDVRTALVTHGKSEGRGGPAILKSCIAFWLPQIDEVLAFHTAQKHHGGYGATYVLLKKSEKKKQKTRDHLLKR